MIGFLNDQSYAYTTVCQNDIIVKTRSLPVTVIHHQYLLLLYRAYVYLLFHLNETGAPRGVLWPQGPCEQLTRVLL